jgi:hypothetical protein
VWWERAEGGGGGVDTGVASSGMQRDVLGAGQVRALSHTHKQARAHADTNTQARTHARTASEATRRRSPGSGQDKNAKANEIRELRGG